MDSIIKQMAMVKCCPFCGQNEPIALEMIEDRHIFYVNCSPQKGGCGATGPICYRMDYAINAWNTRKEIIDIAETAEKIDNEEPNELHALNKIIEYLGKKAGDT